MRKPIFLALLLSVVLIGVALWTRVSRPVIYSAQLESITPPTLNSLAKDFQATSTTSTTTPSHYTDTDFIAHQLVLDYVNLATSGTASDKALSELADRYVESIPTIDKSVKLSLNDIKGVANDQDNFEYYATKITGILKQHNSEMNVLRNSAGKIDGLGDNLKKTTSSLSTTYQSVANDIKNLPVPYALVEAHLKLINNYLSTSASLREISNIEEDSASAFASAVILSNDLDEELNLIQGIIKILNSHGI